MMIPDEENREGVKDFMFLSALTLCLAVDESESLSDSFFRILTCEASVDEVVQHVDYYQCVVYHIIV